VRRRSLPAAVLFTPALFLVDPQLPKREHAKLSVRVKICSAYGQRAGRLDARYRLKDALASSRPKNGDQPIAVPSLRKPATRSAMHAGA
jgi:hypothetical protein